MRILLVHKYALLTSGSDLHCLELAGGLRERGHEAALLSTADAENVERRGAFVSRTVSNATRGQARAGGAARVALQALWNRSAAAATERLIAEFRPDVVHVHKLYPQLSAAPVVVASARGVPIVQTVHDFEFISASPLDDSGGWVDREESRPSYRVLNTGLFGLKHALHIPRVDLWITVSRSVRDAYAERGIESTVMPNFTQPFGGTPASFEGRSGAAFVGRLTEEKGVRHLLELAERLPDLPIAIAGEGPLAGDVEQAAAASPRLAYLGKLDRPAVTDLLGSARVLLVPSLWREPGGLVSLEAMAAGTPVVAYDRGGLAEYVSDAQAGILVPPSAEALAAGVAEVYDDPARWERMSASAWRAIEEHHTLPGYLDRLEKFYEDLIGRRAKSRLRG
jgi:glycosyltransferase involved in cell wall biosynthesis